MSLDIMRKMVVDICIPTMDNFKMLHSCVQSIRENTQPRIYRILIANNGMPKTLDGFAMKDGSVQVFDIGRNVGWEGGINFLLKKSNTDFFMMLNDDTHIVPNDPLWLLKMLSEFRDPSVGAVGPSSNYVMQKQNIFWQGLPRRMNVPVLIGLCLLMRRKLLDELGGLAPNLPGGDDLDLSMRIEKEGYKLRALRDVFIYHHGGQTGRRVFGDYWDSEAHQDLTNTELIRRNGFKRFLRCRNGSYETSENPKFEGLSPDAEGTMVKSYMIGKKIADIGCGANKTSPEIIGVDVFPKGETIPSLTSTQSPNVSEADVVAAADKLPFADNEMDCVVVRHVLEHVINSVRNLREWARVIRPGGRLIIAVPDESQVKGIPLNPEHVHAYTEESLTDLVESVLPNFKRMITEKCNNGMSFMGVYVKTSN